MSTHPKLVLAAFAAVLALTLGATTANAARSFSITNNALLTYTGSNVTFREPNGVEIICSVTLTASLHATGAKTRGTLVGFVNGARGGFCNNSLGTRTNDPIFLVSHFSPWHITLESFRGTLPRITEVLLRIERFRFLIGLAEPFMGGLVQCLYQGEMRLETRGRTGAAEYTLESFRARAAFTLFESGLDRAPLIGCASFVDPGGATFVATLPPVFRLI